jgi:prophage antirepressor-like protein
MQVVPFNFENTTLRVVTGDNGEPLFVGKDLCEALGYKDTTNAMKQHCRGVAKHHPIIDSLGRTQEARVLTEADMFRLIVSSTLPAAERFEAWVFEEVLPTIRKTGSYTAPSSTKTHEAVDLMPRMVAAAISLGFDKNAAAISANQAVLKLTGTNMLSLLGGTHLIAEKQDLIYTPTELGANFLGGISARKVNMLLAEAGMQSKEGEDWKPLPEADGLYRLLDTGKKHGGGTPIQQIKWFESVVSKIKDQDSI